MKNLKKHNSINIYNYNAVNVIDAKITLEEFDKEPIFYRNVIRPMLEIGQEEELINWLRNIGLISSNQLCNKIINDKCCEGIMNCKRAKSMDKYQWNCKKCSRKLTIRENSFFKHIKCHFSEIIRILVGWCKGIDIKEMTTILCTKRSSVISIYNVAAKVARSCLTEWKLGGPGVVVLIDTYPEGLKNIERNNGRHQQIPILCIAELKEIPTRYWFQVLNNISIYRQEDFHSINMAALTIVQKVVLPGSILVTNVNSKICSYNILLSLKHLYPIIVTKNSLEKHDYLNQLSYNLETVWRPGLQIIEDSQYYPLSEVQNYLINAVWRQRFGNNSFEMLIKQMRYKAS